MEDLPLGKTRRFLVVHPDVLIAEDLRETILALRGATVDLRRDLPDRSVPGAFYDMAIIGLPLAQLIDNAFVETLRLRRTVIVILNGATSLDAPETHGFYSLAQPFRTEDVMRLLRQLAV